MRGAHVLFPRSVRGRLWTALGMLSFAVLAVSSLTWLALQRVDERLQDLHRQSLTRVALAIDLSKRSSDLAVSAPYLLSQRSNYLIEEEGTKLISELDRVRNDWPETAPTGEDSNQQAVVAITYRMQDGISDLVAASQDLDTLQSELRRDVAQLGTLRERANLALQDGQTNAAALLDWWALKAMNSDVLNAAYAGNLIGVGEEQRNFQRQRARMDAPNMTAQQGEFLDQLDAIVAGPDGLFELRRRELSLQLQAQNALFRLRNDANAINQEAVAYATRAEAVLTGERSASSTMINVTRVSVAVISLASLALALIAALFVSRYVASNIAQVSDAMVRLANGDRTPALPRKMGGNDEIGDLFRSYRFFRANALRLDRSNTLLDRRNALFEKVFANISDGIAITDAAGRISARNPAFGRILRVTDSTHFKMPFVDWLRSERFATAAQGADLGINYRGFVELAADDGQVLELRSSRLPDEGRVWLIADVTERRKLADRMEQIDRIETLGKVAGDTAHDFANILSTIRTHAHLLDTAAPAALSPNISAIENAVDFGTSLTDRLLAFSKKQRLAPEIIDLNPLVAGLIDLAEVGLKDGVALDVAYADAPLLVLADPGQLESALFNLILNANNAIATKGTVRIALSRNDQGDAQVIVADDGCGMSADVRRRAIEPFFTTRANDGGTGLGLSIVYGFIKQSGGNIELESEEGHFTRITIILPLANSAAVQGSPAKGKALVVDDDPRDLDHALSIFTALGYDSTGCGSVSDAQDLLDQQVFDLVVSDLDLGPEQNGADLLGLIRTNYPRIKRILVSGRSTGQTALHDDDNFLNKPLAREEIEGLLNGPETPGTIRHM